MDAKLSEAHHATQKNIMSSSQNMTEMHKQSVGQIASITEKLSKLEETNKQVVGFSEQLQNLQDICLPLPSGGCYVSFLHCW